MHISRPPLIRPHAGGGVAFEVLDGAIAFARRQFDVGHCDVVVKIDKAAFAFGDRRQAPDRHQRADFLWRDRQRLWRTGLAKTAICGGIAAHRRALAEAAFEGIDAVRSTGDGNRLTRFAGQETSPILAIV